MALSEGEVKALYKNGEYRRIVNEWEKEDPKTPMGFFELYAAWAHLQLGDYSISTKIMFAFCRQHPADSEFGDSARRCLSHGLFQLGRVEEGRRILTELYPSLDRDNVRANAILQDARANRPIPVDEVQRMLFGAIWTVPHQVVNAHIINNLTFALHEARAREEVCPFRWNLPGLIEIAIAIYQETGAPKNHQAGVLFRAANIFLEVPGWEKPALGLADQSVALWAELFSAQGGKRYKQNFENALKLRERILSA